MLASRLHGDKSAYVDLMKVDWRDGESRPLLSFDLGRLAASNLDWTGDSMSIEEVSLSNFESQATIDADGNPHVMGIVLTTPAPSTQPSAGADSANATTRPIEELTRPLPNIVLNQLDLDVAHFTLHDERRPGAAPIRNRGFSASQHGADHHGRPESRTTATGTAGDDGRDQSRHRTV